MRWQSWQRVLGMSWAKPCQLFLVLGLIGCEARYPAVPITDVWEGESLEIRVVDRDSNACASTFPYIDQHYRVVAEAFAGAAGERPTYWWVSKQYFVEDLGCPEEASGCITYDNVYTTILPFEHELTHLVTQQHGGCHVLLNEGLAEIYNIVPYSPYLTQPIEGSMSDLLSDMTATSLPPEHYALAGSFTDYILTNYGMDRIFSICELAPLRSDQTQLEDAFVTVLDTTLADLISAYESGSIAQPWDYLRMPAACSDDDVLVLGLESPVEFDANLECDAEYVLGAPGEDLRYQRRLDVIDGVEYEFTFGELSEEVRVRLISCDPGIDRFFSEMGSDLNNLGKYYTSPEPGSYVFVVWGPEMATMSVSARSLF
jgi:hypothetical protein